MATQLETRLQNRIERRDMVQTQHEELLRERGDADLSDGDKQQIDVWRGMISGLDKEIEQLTEDVEAAKLAEERSKALVRARARSSDGVEQVGDNIVYRDFYAYARDYVLSRAPSLAKQWANEAEVNAMRSRLDLVQRTPANTLSSNVAGLTPAQHITQIMQIINTSRPVVQSARRTTLERGQITYPVITQRPLVAVQAAEKTEAGNQGMVIGMETATASTYLGGGDLSWQAINWSTPDALQMWFDLAAESYATLTEADAATVVSSSGFANNISSTLAALTDFSDVLAALAAGAGDVYNNSGRMADTVYMDPGAFYSVAAIAGTESANFVSAGQVSLRTQGGSLAGLNVVVSAGFNAGEIIVGDSQALLVAETAGAPVELRAVEPAIGGVEVGIIGAFEAVVVDDGAFALITTAS